MSWQSDITQAIATLTQRLNDITTSAKKIFELPWQNILNPASEIHVSISGESQKINVQQILDAALSFKRNQLVEANITVDGNDVTVDAGAKWIINNINHELASDFIETIPYAEIGYTRNDILVGNESNFIYRITGPETEGISPTPNVPINTVLITTINVTDSTIGYVPPVIGDDFEVKTNKQDSLVPDGTSVKYPTVDAVNDGLDLKLNITDYNDRFKGVFTTLAALNAAYPTANAGDSAQVNEVGSTDVVNYSWDAEENIWVEGGSGGSGATNTDALPEGSTNLYFTTARVLATLLTGISFATGGAIVSTDSVLIALGKIQKQINDALTSIGLKQDTLVSGINIKTVNGSTILGSGDLVVGSGDMTTTTAQTVSGLKTFLSGMFGLRNVANTFTSFFTNSNTASRTYTLQDRNGTLADNTDLGLKINKAGDTFTGPVVFPASTTTIVPINIPEGVTKTTSPATGDIQNLNDRVQIRKASTWYSFMFSNAPNPDLSGASKALTVDAVGMPVAVDLQGIVVNTIALVSGVATITITGVTTSSICMATQMITPSGTQGAKYKAVCTASTLTITAIDLSGSPITTDNSTISYTVLL